MGRRTLRIPPTSVSDAQIAHLVSVLDADQSGQVSISELVDFIEAEDDIGLLKEQHAEAQILLEQLHAAKQELMEDLRSKTVAWRIDESCTKVNPIKGLELDSLPPAGSRREAPIKPGRNRKQNLAPEVVQKLRARMLNAAVNAVDAERQLEVLLGRFDKDGSGQLEYPEVRKAIRRQLKIQDNVISDADIMSFCGHLDADGTGLVNINSIIAFVCSQDALEKSGTSLAPINTVDARRPATSPQRPTQAKGGASPRRRKWAQQETSPSMPSSARSPKSDALRSQEAELGESPSQGGNSLPGIKLEPLGRAAELST